jgi:hypothetical protein
MQDGLLCRNWQRFGLVINFFRRAHTDKLTLNFEADKRFFSNTHVPEEVFDYPDLTSLNN